MGFTTGFTGGVTVTLGLAYLTVLAHERNRQAQAHALRSQSRVLNGLLEPTPLPPPQTRAELAREERSTIAEAAKDRWNAEVENASEKSTEGIEQAERAAGPKVQEAVDRSKAAEGVNKAAAATIAGAQKSGAETSKIATAAKAKAEEAATNSNAGAHDAIRKSGGTVDAARGAVRDAVSKGIEKGKEAIGKAHAAIGLAEERIESKSQASALSHSSAVEKALHERYENPDSLNKSVEETLEERYKPIDARDNTSLRGVTWFRRSPRETEMDIRQLPPRQSNAINSRDGESGETRDPDSTHSLFPPPLWAPSPLSNILQRPELQHLHSNTSPSNLPEFPSVPKLPILSGYNTPANSRHQYTLNSPTYYLPPSIDASNRSPWDTHSAPQTPYPSSTLHQNRYLPSPSSTLPLNRYPAHPSSHARHESHIISPQPRRPYAPPAFDEDEDGFSRAEMALAKDLSRASTSISRRPVPSSTQTAPSSSPKLPETRGAPTIQRRPIPSSSQTAPSSPKIPETRGAPTTSRRPIPSQTAPSSPRISANTQRPKPPPRDQRPSFTQTIPRRPVPQHQSHSLTSLQQQSQFQAAQRRDKPTSAYHTQKERHLPKNAAKSSPNLATISPYYPTIQDHIPHLLSPLPGPPFSSSPQLQPHYLPPAPNVAHQSTSATGDEQALAHGIAAN
ncbi:hypothetical protein G7Y89_g10066 [Cudoniella acicularis]|uniref:MICOS complex subunit MIC12 n=1 Tax=Cudoniella acicularis TaxID=354080 RepID=A0A8H4W1Z6_9HELO|nr:hypothetical protein G7Y89_g10066 [Cudoniella acicularis]